MSLIDRILGRGGYDYIPRQWGEAAIDEVDVAGTSFELASRNYYAATLDYMMSAEEYRSIRLDLSHRVKLVNTGRNVIANRAAQHRNEPVYTVAVRFCVSRERNGTPSFTSVRLMALLASDYDRFMVEAGAVALV